MNDEDFRFREVFLDPIRKCANYRPAFGKGKAGGISLDSFQSLYGNDSFYSWIGLDDPLMYAAHKAAGGITSVYRQIGIGTERLFRAILGTYLNLTDEQMNWGYEYDKPDGKKGVHTLDACIHTSNLNQPNSERFIGWLGSVKKAVASNSSGAFNVNGAVFEVRQGYKSADSKRQNADLRFGIRAYQAGLLPTFAIMSTQVSEPVLRRYRNDGILVVTGVLSDDPTISTFAFFNNVVGYDLVSFFDRNSPEIKSEIKAIVEQLLSA